MAAAAGARPPAVAVLGDQVQVGDDAGLGPAGRRAKVRLRALQRLGRQPPGEAAGCERGVSERGGSGATQAACWLHDGGGPPPQREP
mgnify:CR=1 FL=1